MDLRAGCRWLLQHHLGVSSFPGRFSAIIDALIAHSIMRKQALESDGLLIELKAVLLGAAKPWEGLSASLCVGGGLGLWPLMACRSAGGVRR